MRIHTNIITLTEQFRDALKSEQYAGRIARTVTFRKLEPHKSRTHKYAYEIQLTSWEPGNGRRRGNDGQYGARSNDWAATYDEWGWLISAIYNIDSLAVFGSAKRPVYIDRHDFDHQTALTYRPDVLLAAIEHPYEPFRGDPYPYVRKGSARVGREGSLRVDGDTYSTGNPIPRYYLDSAYRVEPRTAEWVRTFAHLDTVGA